MIASVLLATCTPVAANASAAPSPSRVPKASATSTATAGQSRSATKRATFGIGPAGIRGLDDRPYLNFLSAPGGSLNDHVGVVNLSSTPLTLSVYATDATNLADGSIGYASRAAKPAEAGSWIEIAHRAGTVRLRLSPHHTTVLPISVTVPRNAQPGDHAAGIVASLASRIVKDGKPVVLEQRVALRAFFRLSGALGPRLSISDIGVSQPATVSPFARSTATVRYTVVNSGNVRLGGRQHVAVSGPFGSVETQGPSLALMLPGGRATFTVKIPDVFPQVRMTARVTIEPLTVTGDVDPNLPTRYEETSGYWAIPWGLFGLALLLLLVIVAIVRHSRRPSTARHGRRSLKAVNA